MTDLTDLLDRWEQEAALLRRCGALEAAATREADAEELRAWWHEFLYEAITLEEAGRYSTWSAATVGNKVRSGEIPNAGTKGRPRVRRADLPAKAPGSSREGALDLADKILR